jgi:iron complex outermembrane receptor protein
MKNPQMKLLTRLVLMACASPLAGVGPAWAQEAPAAAAPADGAKASAGLEEVVVTARRTRERLQDVPTSVSAITAKNIDEQKITGFDKVAQSIPNVYIQPQGGSPAAAQMQIRGVSNGSLNKQVDSGIGLYVDGVYFGRAGASAFELADLERVEVLRGPQGTLFGRNATAGAINLVTAGPTGQFGGKAMVGFGNFGARNAKLTLNTPEFYGLAARLTLGHSEIEGDQKNTAPRATYRFTGAYNDDLTTNRRGGDNKSDNVLLAVRYTGVDRLRVDYKADTTRTSGTMNYRQTGLLSNGTSGTPLGFTYNENQYQPLEGEFSNRVYGQSLTGEFQITNELSAKYIYGARRYDLSVPGNQVVGDLSAAPGTGGATSLVAGGFNGELNGLFAARAESHRQRSHELQLIGKHQGFDWIVGAFAFQEAGGLNNPILFAGSTFDPATPIVVDPAAFHYFVGQNLSVDNKSKAAYGHFNWSLTDQWVFAAGLRRSLDKRAENIVNAGILANSRYEYRGGNTDYDAALTYKFDQDTNVYGKYATGYVSGGTLGGTSFDPEKMRAAEVGFKTLALERKLRLNAAIFRQKRVNAQIEYFGATGYSMGKADSRQTGLELEASYRATRALTLNTSYGYTQSKSSGDIFVTQPRQTVYAGGDYRFGQILDGVTPVFRLDVNWRPGYYTIKCPAGQTQDPGKDTCSGTVQPELNQAARLKSATNIDARMSFNDIRLGAKANGRLSFWARNLLDNKNVQYNFTLGANVLASTYERPRTFGVDFTADF